MARFIGNGKADNPELIDEAVTRPLADFAEKMLKEKEKTTSAIEKRLHQRIAQVQLESSARSQIQVRLQGFFRKPHPGDQARYEAAKANEDLAILLTDIVRNHSRIAVYTHYVATDAKKAMMQRDWELPSAVQEYGALLSGLNSELLAQTVVEVMTMYPEIALGNVKRAMNQQ